MSVVIGKPAFWADCFLVLPDEPGQPSVFKFKARFKRLNTEESKALDKRLHLNQERLQAQVDAMVAKKPVPEFVSAITDVELVNDVLVDWDGMQDAHGGNVPYTPAARDQLFADYAGMDTAFARAFLKNRNPDQVIKDAEKNSEALPATT